MLNPLPRGTKGRILRLLRGREHTADEIAAALEVTPNGARFHLTELERDGLVAQRSVRRGARKPSHGYSLSETGEALFPKRYDALVNAVLRDARDRMGNAEMDALFRRLGHRMAAEQAHRFAGMAPGRRIDEALRVVAEIGGAADAVVDPARPDHVVVEGRLCPLAAVVSEHGEVCVLLETFLQDTLPGSTVRQSCQKDSAGTPPRCRFSINLPAD